MFPYSVLWKPEQIKQESIGDRGVVISPTGCQQYPSDVRPQGRITNLPGHRSLLHFSLENCWLFYCQSDQASVALSCTLTSFWKVHLWHKLMKMSWLNCFSSIQHVGANGTWFIVRGIRCVSPFSFLQRITMHYLRMWFLM